ncbi:MAG: hypothetical protein H6993_08355 [Pseudomonadales bacterium]|nr:hypothetical protein [Pseudomonadales bacterium]MCP5183961.1 hypothetical protein [Pseudomonadales bacterium]
MSRTAPIFLGLLVLLAACQSPPVTTPVVLEPPRDLRLEMQKVAKPQIARPVPAGNTATVAPTGPVIVVVSRNTPVYSDVARAFAAAWDAPSRIVYLDDENGAPLTLTALTSSHPLAVVAIGDAALQFVETVDVDVVYAQTFRAGSQHRGVDALPPADAQLRQWAQDAPALKRIGVIAGRSFAGYASQLAAAAEPLDLSMDVRIVQSESDAREVFRQLVPTIDAFIFLPDQTVFSPSSIQDILAVGRSNDIQFLSYNPLIRHLGAQWLISQDAGDVADGLVALLRNPDRQRQALAAFYIDDGSHRQRVAADG